MKVSLATPDDAQNILALQHLAYQAEAAIYDDRTLPPLLDTLDVLASCFNNRRFLKAVDGNRIVGSIRGYQEGATCFVERLIVHPDYRRQGIGADLLKQIESVFPSAWRFELFTGRKSEANIRLYERMGYRTFRQQQVNDRVTLVFMEKSSLTITLDRLQLIAATQELLQSEADHAELGQGLQAEVPSNWPMPLYNDSARQFFLSVLRDNPGAVGWTTWYILLLDASGRKTLIGGIGACGLPNENGEIVIGYSLLDQFHGKGYATEALHGLLGWARPHANLRKVIADTFPHLTASIRVLEKSGFVRRGAGAEEGSIRFELALR